MSNGWDDTTTMVIELKRNQKGATITDTELLKKSCDRLPRLIELKSPAVILLNELSLLTGLAIAAIRETMNEESRSRRDAIGKKVREAEPDAKGK